MASPQTDTVTVITSLTDPTGVLTNKYWFLATTSQIIEQTHFYGPE